MASIATGIKATTFNPAGLTGDHISYARAARQRLFAESSSPGEEEERVSAYISEDDPLNRLQDSTPAPSAYGTQHRVDPPGSPQEAFDRAFIQAKNPFTCSWEALDARKDAELAAHDIKPIIDELE